MNSKQISRKLKELLKAVCHRKRDRSFIICGEQLLVCARCTGICIGFILSMIILVYLYGGFNLGANLLLVAIFFVPMGIDGLAQLVGRRESTNQIRFGTGFLGGIGLAYFLYASYTILFFMKDPVVKLPTLKSLIVLPFLFVFFAILKKYNHSHNKFFSYLFNALIVISLVAIYLCVAFLFVYYITVSLILYS